MNAVSYKGLTRVLQGSLIYLNTVCIYAYTPPFDGKYAQGTVVRYGAGPAGDWGAKMKSVWGSELRVLEKIHPGIMVDSTGTLYYITHDAGMWFGGKQYYVGKITPAGVLLSQVGLQPDQKVGSNYSWPASNGIKTIENDTNFSKMAWVSLAPCMAQEANGTTDYVHAIVYVVPPRWWNTGSGPDTEEGLLFVRLKKLDLSVTATGFRGGWNTKPYNFGDFTTLTYNKNVFTAIYDVGVGRTSIFWLHKFSADGNYDSTNDSSSNTRLNREVFNDQGGYVFNQGCTYGVKELAYKHCIEPRIMKVGNEYHFATSNGYYPYWIKAETTERSDTTFADYNPYMDGYDSNTSSASCCYHNDLNVIQHGGQTIALQLAMSKTSRLNDAGGQWNASYISWNTSYVVLVLYSWPAGYVWHNSKSRPIPTENCIATFPVTSATSGYDTSTTTLYKNTHMFVVYNDYIIYAYCYPGKKTHLVLGVTRYRLDSNSDIHLLTKREFVDQDGNSFGNLTNCSRIIFMDVKNGYLWLVFASVDNKTFYYFCIPAQDVIEHAI
ncbi:MAG: hypothetical protein LBJ78_03970 [Puniceicoccales bacterium]|nr:hypothetical protein [Puniceicoccales bacterium]